MISLIKTDTIKNDENEKIITGEFIGLSTDTKPTTYNDSNVGNGSLYVEIDTGKIYFYDLENDTWHEFKNGSSPSPTPVTSYLTLGQYKIYNSDGTRVLDEYSDYTNATGSLVNYNTGETVWKFNDESPIGAGFVEAGTYQLFVDSASDGENTVSIQKVRLDIGQGEDTDNMIEIIEGQDATYQGVKLLIDVE